MKHLNLSAFGTQEGEPAVEIMFVYHTEALSGKSRFKVIVVVVEMVVGFQAQTSAAVEQVLKVEISYKCGG